MTRSSVRAPVFGSRAPGAGRRRALLVLGGVGVLALVLVVALAVSLGSLLFGSPGTSPAPGQGTGPGPGPGPSSTAGRGPQAELALARAPMLELPASAVTAHALSTRSAGPALAVPAPTQVTGALVAGGFPATPEGAAGQLIELTRSGLAGADPLAWGRAYASIAEPGAAAADQTPLYRDLVALRRSANMAPSGARDGMTITWTPTDALVKGTTDDGVYTVVCVLGELAADYRGRVSSGGLGNCLPMRRVGDRWMVASGPTAWAAPSAWPGSAESVAAGWREIRR